MERIFLVTGAATSPVPRGAGMRRTRTEPHLPMSLLATVCGRPEFFPQ